MYVWIYIYAYMYISPLLAYSLRWLRECFKIEGMVFRRHSHVLFPKYDLYVCMYSC